MTKVRFIGPANTTRYGDRLLVPGEEFEVEDGEAEGILAVFAGQPPHFERADVAETTAEQAETTDIKAQPADREVTS